MSAFLANFPLSFIISVYTIAALLLVGFVVSGVRWFIRSAFARPNAFRMVVLRITIPKESQEDTDPSRQGLLEHIKERIGISETFFASLAGVRAQRGWSAFWYGRNDHFALEIVADKEGLVSFYAVVPRFFRQYVEQQLHAQYESADIQEVEDYNIFEPQGVVLASRLRLEKHQMFAINTYDKMSSDPLNTLTNVLSKFERHEGACIQVMLRSAHPSWHRLPSKVARTMQQGKSFQRAYREATANIFYFTFDAIRRGLFKRTTKAEKGIDIKTEREYRLSPMEEEVVKMLEDKTSRAGFEVNIRVIVSAKTLDVAKQKCENVVNAFSQFAMHQYGNRFIASRPQEAKKVIEDFIYRNFAERGAFVLNSKEMSSIWHLPLSTTETPNIRWLAAKKSAPPANLPQEGLMLGKVLYRGTETTVRIKRGDRRRHVYIIGKSGVGKSELLKSMAIQDIQHGEGVGVIDPHGDLVEDILKFVPRERADDVVYFDPSDIERPMGLNMLEYETHEQRDFAVQEMVAIFYKLFGEEMIGPMFEHYMRNAMLALMEDKETGATLIEIPRMFTDKEFRKTKLQKVQNMIVKNFWEGEYEQSQAGQQAADMLSYVISKIGRFLTNDMMRNIIGQARSAFNFKDVMNDQKILLVNLSKGKLGEVNSSLLGLILVSKLQIAAMSRADMPQEKRKDFYLYIDEFQNFATDSIATILSEARKYMLNLIVAHQYISQMVHNNDTRIRDAVFGNVGTIITFRVGVEDAEVFAKEFAPVFDENDCVNVEKYAANLKLLIDNTTSRPFTMQTVKLAGGDATVAAMLKELSRLKYGCDQLLVEQEIRTRARWDSLRSDAPVARPDVFA